MEKKTKIRSTAIALSPEQKRAVLWNDGAVMIDAGPGSGKTRVVVERIARMINDKTCKPEQILATTFTKKAAEEMNLRLEAKKIDTSRMSVQTTHSLCFKIMNEDKEFKSWSFDDKERYKIILKLILGYKEMNWVGNDQTLIEQFISMCRYKLVEPANCDQYLQGDYADSRFKMAYMMYDQRLREQKLYTFDDMLYHGVRVLQSNQQLLGKYQARYRYVIVDETQDNNYAQVKLCDLISAPEYNLMIVGDTDQAIYEWRGAIPDFMVSFAKEYNADVIQIVKNYRSCPEIVGAAAMCIEHNQNRTVKELTANRTTPASIKFTNAETTDEEAKEVAVEILAMMQDGIRPGNIAVMMRTNAQSRPLEEEFISKDIPFIVLGAASFYERKEIKRLLAYLRVIVDPKDSENGELAMKSPYRMTSMKLHEYVRDKTNRTSFAIALEMAIDNGYAKGFTQDKLVDFLEVITSHKPDSKPDDVIKDVVAKFDYIDWLKNEDGSDSLETNREQNIGELIRSAARFATCNEFIAYVDKQIRLRKQSQRKITDSKVIVATIHKLKGLEFASVFIVGAVGRVLPHAKGKIEEERRLFYVAVTRAKDSLHILSYKRSLDGQGNTIQFEPSQFIEESGIETNVLTSDVDIANVDISEQQQG